MLGIRFREAETHETVAGKRVLLGLGSKQVARANCHFWWSQVLGRSKRTRDWRQRDFHPRNRQRGARFIKFWRKAGCCSEPEQRRYRGLQPCLCRSCGTSPVRYEIGFSGCDKLRRIYHRAFRKLRRESISRKQAAIRIQACTRGSLTRNRLQRQQTVAAAVQA